MEHQLNSDITTVLKALNHEVRRKIVRIMHEKSRPLSYSIFLDQLNLPASSNVAYHLSLLVNARLIQKDNEGKYSLTQLGSRSGLLLDLVSETKSSTFSDLVLGFSRLTPIESILASWWIFFIITGTIILQSLIIAGLLLISFGLASLALIIYRTKTFWVFLLLNNFLWVYFAPEHRLLLLLIILSNVFGAIFLFPEIETNVLILGSEFYPIIGLLLVILSLLLSIFYLYSSIGFELKFFVKEKKE